MSTSDLESDDVDSSPADNGGESRGSSVSTELREEYEDLLRYAVVTPKYEALVASLSKPPIQQGRNGVDAGGGGAATHMKQPSPSKIKSSSGSHSPPQHPSAELAVVASEESGSSQASISAPTTSHVTPESVVTFASKSPGSTSSPPFKAMNVKGKVTTSVYLSRDKPRTSHNLTRSSQDPVLTSHHLVNKSRVHPLAAHDVRMDFPNNNKSHDHARLESNDSMDAKSSATIDPEMTRLANQIDLSSMDLKRNLLAEFEQSRLRMIDSLQSQFLKEREQQVYDLQQVKEELERYKELLVTYEQSIGRKDHIISNLTKAMKKNSEKLDLQRSFFIWKLNLCDEKREAFTSNLSIWFYNLKLKRRVWEVWFSLIQQTWKEKTTKACQTKAEEVCVSLSNDYEEELIAVKDMLEKTQQEVKRLEAEKELYEENMKKAFMRGVCALNMEAMSMFKTEDRTSANSDGDYQVPPHTSNDLMPHPLPSAYRKTHQAMVQFQNDSPPTNNVEERHTTIHVTATSSSMGRGKGRGMTRQSGHAQKGVSSHIPTVLVQRHSV